MQLCGAVPCIINEGQILYPVYSEKESSSYLALPLHYFHPHAERAACPGSASICWISTVGCGRWNKNDAHESGCSEDASWHQWVAVGQNPEVCLTEIVCQCACVCRYGHTSHPTPPLFASFSHLLHRSWHQPRGCKAKWSLSEEGHPLGMLFGTKTAVTFPLHCPSVGFGPLLWTSAQIWPGFRKHACTGARPVYTGLFCKYWRQQLNVGIELGIWALESGVIKTLRQGHSHDIHIPIL